jgi:hypothetical protein
MAGTKPKDHGDSIAGVSSVKPGGRGEKSIDETHGSTAIKHLVSLERLFNAAHDLMKQEPSLDKAAFEHLRQLRVRIRFAISAAASDQTNELPMQAPAKWSARHKEESPLSFLTRTYAAWLQRPGTICRADIRRLDPGLYRALYNCKISSKQLDEIGLPTKKALNDQRLQARSSPLKRPSQPLRVEELSRTERETLRLYEVARSRRKRRRE